MTLMTIGQRGLDLIKDFEGLRLEAYKCPAGVLTIGYGSTYGVKPGMKITLEEAEERLRKDVRSAEIDIHMLERNIPQNAFDALCSWIYNLGSGAFSKSTMKRYIMENKDDMEITDQMVKWHNAGGRPLVGLKRRRIAEANMFLGRDAYYLDRENNIKRR